METVNKIRRYQETIELERFEGDLNPREELVWKEEEYEDSKTLYLDKSKIMSFVHMSLGYQSKFPFNFKLPTIGRETYHSVDKNVEWSVTAYMKATNRKDLRSRVGEILVAKPTVSATPTKEVVREVVLIQCANCNGLMPQTAIFCPNCGTRRKS